MFELPDPDLDTALKLSESDPEQAAQVLRIAADYLINQKQLPSALAFFLGYAFEHAMKKASICRGSELLINLNLKVAHRRPKANFENVGMEVERLVYAKVPKGEAIIQAAEAYGLNESTVKRMHTKYLAHKASEDADNVLLYEEEQRHYAQQSTVKNTEKLRPVVKGKRLPSSDLDRT